MNEQAEVAAEIAADQYMEEQAEKRAKECRIKDCKQKTSALSGLCLEHECVVLESLEQLLVENGWQAPL